MVCGVDKWGVCCGRGGHVDARGGGSCGALRGGGDGGGWGGGGVGGAVGPGEEGGVFWWCVFVLLNDGRWLRTTQLGVFFFFSLVID